MDFFKEDYWSPSEITATILNIINILFNSYNIRYNANTGSYVYYILLSILILGLYYGLKLSNKLPLGVWSNIGYFVITFIFLMVIPIFTAIRSLFIKKEK